MAQSRHISQNLRALNESMRKAKVNQNLKYRLVKKKNNQTTTVFQQHQVLKMKLGGRTRRSGHTKCLLSSLVRYGHPACPAVLWGCPGALRAASSNCARRARAERQPGGASRRPCLPEAGARCGSHTARHRLARRGQARRRLTEPGRTHRTRPPWP